MKIVGHRGAKGLAPENTMQAFEKALQHHVDEIELDVRMSKDGELVITHDASVHDAAGNKIDVHLHDLATLRDHRPNLITLETALRGINRRVPTYVEVKPGVPTGPVIALISVLLQEDWLPSDFLFGSYDQQVLRELHKALPEISTIVIEDWSGVRALRRARELGTNRISMLEYWLWPGFIHSMAHRGIQLYSFTGRRNYGQRLLSLFGLAGASNTPKKARRWERAGLAGVITDYPDLYEKKIRLDN